MNNQRVRRFLRGNFAVVAVVIVVFAVSVFSVFFFPLVLVVPRPVSHAVGLVMVIVFAGPEVFRAAVHPAATSAWPAVSWIVIAVGFGIATRNVASRMRVFGYAVLVVFAWLSWQEVLANRYI